ncbi:hypothetical protein RSOLAG1IB_03581 [Rhizoctonia solani AG-1 IB]|uniref:F-box domain-containing protein n=1 Tax=Thanatephorus cucumeris (strain AG1-IB / isolate 7/3/14) TaxID=1108050 RepID=A0A0B7FTU8_THACB|nr:hypothetical protein RSOLAG1IB_03581 [Rhizoctonia solani AG-1 IB]
MSQKHLPTELIQCIAEYLTDPLALASLCLVDKQILGIATPLLYSSVRVTTYRGMTSLCHSILSSNRNPGRYVTAAHFDPVNPADVAFCSLIEEIYLALHKTPNLKELYYRINSPNTIILFRSGWAPFTLRRFACYCTMKPQFLFDFLSSQSSIRYLTIYEDRPCDRYLVKSIRFVPREVLPNLTFICADPLTVHAFIPHRPISCIDSINGMFMAATTHLLCDALKLSTAPKGVQSISACVPATRFWTGASDFITKLEGICGGTLREMVLTMPELSVGMLKLHEYAPLVEVLAASLMGFTCLEHFEFKDKGIELITIDILLEGLGKVGTLAFWQEQIKSLTSVKLFGVKLI